MRNGVIIDDRDNVVVAIYPLHAGDEVTYALPGGESGHVVANQDVPLFHKVARQDIKAGQAVHDVKIGFSMYGFIPIVEISVSIAILHNML